MLFNAINAINARQRPQATSKELPTAALSLNTLRALFGARVQSSQ